MSGRNKDISYKEVLDELNLISNKAYLEGMKRFGINITTTNALGVSIPDLRKLARKLGKNHSLAISLWHTNIHEARILASFIDDPAAVTEKQMERWVNDFSSWDL